MNTTIPTFKKLHWTCIASHWDPSQEITTESCPREEFEIWLRHCASNLDDWTGQEFDLRDFQNYISNLK